ncbi:hypothetical protein GCM10029978_004210 [Actinoallomurus acanthiterrae]
MDPIMRETAIIHRISLARVGGTPKDAAPQSGLLIAGNSYGYFGG